MTSPIRILIVDDHRMFREGIRSRLARHGRFKVVGEAASAEEALESMQQAAPSIVILDIRMPGTSGIDLARRLRHEWPDVKILVLSGYDFDQYVRALARIGIQGYLLKDSPQEALIEALDEIARGGVVLPPRIASKVMRSYASDSVSEGRTPTWDLTVRELEILECLHEGLRNAEIASRLDISPRTVETHVSTIISKLGARSRTEAVRKAVQGSLIR
ncbi:MAG TPA: response regulator transcription factor [Candidatus Polarisedimenticolia bacterium]|nr:response regulator transcription factor [Candidatus Polarisedimenticolia bacterium]